MVRERWWVTKLGVKDGVCDRVVCRRWFVTKLRVKDGVSKMVGDKVVCERCHACWAEAKPRRM